ncbi:MAG: pyridoxal phosphate-dependent aminotransferase [Gammaproteobacteria bacterium]|nr:pyridoxal phosphate-dependent aminotransferase [Gammaproteobacteria bacterium]
MSDSVEGSPDEFMFRQFRRHTQILRSNARHDYFMLSGGANYFPMSDIWKELLSLELASDLAYGWYTAQEGFPSLQRAVSMWENFAASQGNFPDERPLGAHVCMTLGASQAAAMVFDYWAKVAEGKRVVFIGLNYGLFERLARHNKFAISECLLDDGIAGTLPPGEQIASALRATGASLVVLATPNNPSGEQYAKEDISTILRAVVETESLVLFDQVGQMIAAQDNFLNIGELIVKEEAQQHAVLINSFSKSDSVPGFRIGYLMGPEQIVKHAARYQLLSAMNPPTVPLLPPFFSLISRCIQLADHLRWTTSEERASLLSFARHMLFVTTAIAPPTVMAEMERRLSGEGFERDHSQYISHQQAVGKAVRQNHLYAIERLGKYVSRDTPLAAGFNFLIELEPFANLSEDDVCRRLFEETSVAILTESCFRISARQRQNFWVRLSLAAPEDRFAKAVDRFAQFLART